MAGSTAADASARKAWTDYHGSRVLAVIFGCEDYVKRDFLNSEMMA